MTVTESVDLGLDDAERPRTKVAFAPPDTFAAREDGYETLPFRHTRIPALPGQVLITSPVGEFLLLSEQEFADLLQGCLDQSSSVYRALRTRTIVCCSGRDPFLEGIEAQRHTRRLFDTHDPALHIFVVTLRCDHRCHYCQVTPQKLSAPGFDMSLETADAALDRVFESDAPGLTIEFQGGESVLAFDRVRYIVEQAERRDRRPGQVLRFVLATTLHLLDGAMLAFCRDHRIELSTSVDGPEHVHNANRPNATRDSYARTVEGIERARSVCGHDRVSALATITRHSLPHAKEIVDTYVELGFDTISLRPISPFGFAVRTAAKLGYSTDRYLAFYREALDYIVQLNLEGVRIEETYASLLLTRILTAFPTSYVDLQSPAAAGRGVLVYNYDGSVYVSDEARMLAEMGDFRFRMGNVHDPMPVLQSSDAMGIIRDAGDAERLPGCSECAFVPYCGADPVHHVATQGDPVGRRPSSEFCLRHTGLFRLFFERLAARDSDTMRVFLAWMRRVPVSDIPHSGYQA